jgi:23S rRNA (uracil1939-C5)-methyltransferase
VTALEDIIRIAAKGDGVTASGRHVALTAPGDKIGPDGAIYPGPNRAEPPCTHFTKCGGCQLQHLSDASYAAYVRDRVAGALAGQGVAAAEVNPAHISPPGARRRASLKAIRTDRATVIGFQESGSHTVIDMAMCPLLHPQLFSLVAPLRALLRDRAIMPRAASIGLTLADQGVDVSLSGITADGLQAAEALTEFARAQGLARLTLIEADGEGMTVWEPEPVTVTLGGYPVSLPSGAFLQATQDGETALAQAVLAGIGEAATVADLFAGLGTFALSVARGRKVYAAEASRDLLLALKRAGERNVLPLFTEHRDLFRRPLVPAELSRFDAVILDPPRAGAREQVAQIAQIAQSSFPALVYVSCNPSSFARDAATLIAGGWALERVVPVGQFRWSTHVELAAQFRKR